ncbi:MAG: B12-binding domain-containing radical SAM protein [Elusimicrobia bacterium]|nr:B12-binding domain-containing radical SAM protein [Elusimicrobiota bacterium]
MGTATIDRVSPDRTDARPQDASHGGGSIDVLFAVSPSNARSVYMPFYFLYLAGYVEKYGITCEIANPHFHTEKENRDAILEEIARLKPRWVGLASFCTDYAVVSDLAFAIKKRFPAVKIVVGNAQPSVNPADFLYEGGPFDIVVRGEGELTLRDIIETDKAGKDVTRITGIAYLENGKVVQSPTRELMDLKDCGQPAYHKIDVSWYAHVNKYLLRRIPTSCGVIFTGRGCPFECGFCAANAVWQANSSDATRAPKARWRPLEHVMAELHDFEKVHRFDFFYILDDVFGLTEDEIRAFCAAYKKSGLKMLWGAETRVNCVRNLEILKVMKDAGCIQLDFGIESGSPKMLKIVNKGITVDQTYRAFELCKKAGIRTFANILLNLPEESEEDLELTHRLLEKVNPTYVSVGVTQPYPGTEFYHRYAKNIPKEDYSKLSRILPPEEFRLAAHKLNLQTLMVDWMWRYRIDTFFERGLLTAPWIYWRKIVSSSKRLAYLRYFLRDFVRSPVHYIVREYFPSQVMDLARQSVHSIGSF